MTEKPPSPEEGRVMLRANYGGSTGYGEYVQLRIQFADKTTEVFRCAFDQMPLLMDSLRAAAEVTAQARAGNPKPSLEAARPYRVTKTRTGQGIDGVVAIQFETELGVPVLVSMPRDKAAELANLLQAELKRPPPKKSELA